MRKVNRGGLGSPDPCFSNGGRWGGCCSPEQGKGEQSEKSAEEATHAFSPARFSTR